MPYWPIYAVPDADTVFDFLTQKQLRYGLIAATEDKVSAQLRGPPMGTPAATWSAGTEQRSNRTAAMSWSIGRTSFAFYS